VSAAACINMTQRVGLVDRLRHALSSAIDGSRVEIVGSLADGTADPYSDIDIRWHVPDRDFERALATALTHLSSAQPV